jgi:hypothetical protein
VIAKTVPTPESMQKVEQGSGWHMHLLIKETLEGRAWEQGHAAVIPPILSGILFNETSLWRSVSESFKILV